MKKLKNIKNLLVRFLLCVLVIIMLIFLPNIELSKNYDLDNIYSVFLGKKAGYSGIIEIWNIDTFEAGNVSKVSLISNIAKEYQNKNKGIYFMVRNLTENECRNLLNAGEYPDLFSCGFGVADSLKEYVKAYSNLNLGLIDEPLKDSVTVNNEILAVPWCKGGYFLITTKEKLENANIKAIDENLSAKVFSSGYTLKNKKSEKIVYSVAFGNSNYLMPQQAVKSYNNSEVDLISNSYNKEHKDWTSYSAYCDFIAGNSVFLLGTQRDVYRMKNREKLGKATDVIIEQLANFTDLIQFMLLSKTLSGNKLIETEHFVNFLIQEKSQSMVSNSGLFSVINLVETKQNNSIMFNITPQNFNNYIVPKLFIDKNEIKTLQNF